MKRTGKIFVSIASLGILLNNVSYAATEVAKQDDGGISTKYIFIGIATLVIILLLFLGYKMDTKGTNSTKVSHKAEKTKEKLSTKEAELQQNSGKYEATEEETYEDDGEIFDNEDLNDSIEYAEDEEDSLYETVNENEESEFSTKDNTIDTIVEEPEDSELKEEKLEEEFGEDFDTSIIDKLDEEEIDPKKSFDETMLFNNSEFSATGSSLEDEIDSLDNIDGSKTKSNPEVDESEINDELEIGGELDTANDLENSDNLEILDEINELEDNNDLEISDELITDGDDNSFIEELKSYEEPESSFGGFSVANKEDEFEKNSDEEIDLKTTAELEEEIDKENNNSSMDDDFLSQMEANLQKNQENRKNKKEANESKATTRKYTKKKED